MGFAEKNKITQIGSTIPIYENRPFLKNPASSKDFNSPTIPVASASAAVRTASSTTVF
jgi:hypothetical protein